MPSGRVLLAAIFIGCSAQIVLAHHGKDFLLVESYDLPEPGEFYLVSSTAIADGNGVSLEWEPSLLVGLMPRVAFELHSHITKEPEQSLDYEATAPSLHFQLSPPNSRFPVRFGLSAEYEIATQAGTNRFETRVIMEAGIGRWKLVGNLLGEHQQGADSDVGYAVGARYDFSHQFAFGFEAQGPFTNDDKHELLVGAYLEPQESITLKVGLGPSIGSDGAGFVARFAVVWRF